MLRRLPFLRWPGGKRWLAPLIEERVQRLTVGRYIEPFLGGAAVFFYFEFGQAILGDVNPELVNVYVQVRDNVNALVGQLQRLRVDPGTYSKMRNFEGGDSVERAVKFLYLNRTAFSGMYRLNRRGQFNVPYGGGERTHHILWEKNLLIGAAEVLRGRTIKCCDFEEALENAGSGDLVYCDPTYTVAHNNNGFRRYNERNFTWIDQERLASACRRIAENGASVVVSNAFHEDLAKLYSGFEKRIVERSSNLCPKAGFRGKTREYLFMANL
jgi:DNA adenine methylase